MQYMQFLYSLYVIVTDKMQCRNFI